jgi:PAS domain S-box-containing protein
MEKKLIEEEYHHLFEGDSSDLREMLAAFLDGGDGIIIADKDGIIKHVNPAYERMTGYSKEELIGKTPKIVSSGLQSISFYKDMWKKLATGEIFKAEFINRRKNGNLYYQSETIAPVKDKSGKIVGYVSNGRDITEESYKEKKLSLLGKMSSSVLLTELKNPISQIIGAAVRLRDFAVKNKNLDVLKDLDIVYTTSKQMGHTLGVLHEFFYPSIDEKDLVDIRVVVDQVLSIINPRFVKQKIVFKIKYEDALGQTMIPNKLWSFVLEELLHHYGSAAMDSKEKNPTVNIFIHFIDKDIAIDIEVKGGSPINNRGECDNTCGCIWVNETDLKFVLMELVIMEAGGLIHYERAEDAIFRTTLIISKVI